MSGTTTPLSQLQYRPDGPALIGVEILKTGSFYPSNFEGEAFDVTVDLMDRIIGGYDPAKIEAYLNIDHVRGGPSLGWVERLYRVGETLCADLKQVAWELIDSLRSGAFKKRSVEISGIMPDSPDAPYLVGLSFLGANQPAVSGLADIVLTGQEKGRLLFASPQNFDPSRVRISFPATAFQSQPTGGSPMPETPAPTPAPVADTVTISRAEFDQYNQLRAKCAEQDSLLAAMRAEIDNLQSNMITASSGSKRIEFAAAYDKAHDSKCVAPAEKADLEADFTAALEADLAAFKSARVADPKAVLKFALADRELAKLARRAPLAHAVNFEKPAPGAGFTAPAAGGTVTPAEAAKNSSILDGLARQFQASERLAGRTVDYATASKVVKAANPNIRTVAFASA